MKESPTSQLKLTMPAKKCVLIAILTLWIANSLFVCQSHNHNKNEAHRVEVDVELGKYTQEQIKMFESIPTDTNLSTKTPPVQLDGGHVNDVLTIVIDFKSATQPATTDVIGNSVGSFDITEYGFNSSEFSIVTDAILAEVQDDFFAELGGTVANQNGQDFEINLMEGDIGTPPPGISEYYFVQVGTGLSGPFTFALGVASGSSVRNSGGSGPNNGVQIGDVVASVFTNNLQGLGNIDPPDALSSGNLMFTRNAVVGTLSHEIGHVLSLSHIDLDMSTQPTKGTAPIMGTGAIDLPNQLRLTDREFSIMGFNAQNGGAQVFQIQQLVGAVGLDDAGAILINSNFTPGTGSFIGGLNQLANNDNNVLEATAAIVDVKGTAPIQFEITADSTLLSPGSISITIDSRSNSPNIDQRIELFNFSTGLFQMINQTPLGIAFDDTSASINALADDFVNQANCQIRARISAVPTGPVLFFPWKIEVDQIEFEVNP